MSSPQTILITGASSGIGAALARYYAQPNITLLVFGQNQERLTDVKKDCVAKGAQVVSVAMNVTDQEGMRTAIDDLLKSHDIDMVIANAGISVGQRERNRELISELFDVNVNGVLNTVMPLIPHFQNRQAGHIVVMSSLAAFQVFPTRGEYAATKIAVRYMADTWRQSLKDDGVIVSSIHPGFVKTPLTDKNTNRMPGIVSAEKAAYIIGKGLAARKAVIAFPRLGYIFVRLLQALPTRVSDMITNLTKPK